LAAHWLYAPFLMPKCHRGMVISVAAQFNVHSTKREAVASGAGNHAPVIPQYHLAHEPALPVGTTI